MLTLDHSAFCTKQEWVAPLFYLFVNNVWFTRFSFLFNYFFFNLVTDAHVYRVSRIRGLKFDPDWMFKKIHLNKKLLMNYEPFFLLPLRFDVFTIFVEQKDI